MSTMIGLAHLEAFDGLGLGALPSWGSKVYSPSSRRFSFLLGVTWGECRQIRHNVG
jgi:hypothetical protein